MVSNNNIYSNTGAGILLAESEHVSVESNTLVDNVKGIELRAMSGRENHQLRNLEIVRNRFKEWRKEAIATSLGEWSPASVAERGIRIDQNDYDPPQDRTFVSWGDAAMAGLPEIRSVLGLEQQGSIQVIQFCAFAGECQDDRRWRPPHHRQGIKGCHGGPGIDDSCKFAVAGAGRQQLRGVRWGQFMRGGGAANGGVAATDPGCGVDGTGVGGGVVGGADRSDSSASGCEGDVGGD